ncbi:EF-hand domain-containing protein [Sandaracinobacteroides hominis]|uniref:EF-hand domain-containing protein n=1 Tax=Sandaracinobacteroides hominis TaxID=2780086 RepID=UPI0018F6D271|nr:EF-hand domain-containing protein [Sandaracinobacteroides hominis]
MKSASLMIAALLMAAPALAQTAPASTTPPAGHGGGKFWDVTDTNKDGVLTADEWKAAGRKPEGFAMMDANKDGKVTREEGRAAMQKMMEARKAAQ